MSRKTFCLAVLCAMGMTHLAGAGLVGWWQFDEGSGAVARDASGNGIDGVFTGSPQWATGMLGGALQFNGGSWVDCGYTARTAIAGTMSVACWVNPDKLGAILAQDRAFLGRDAAYTFKASGKQLRFTTPGVRDHTATNGVLKTGTWQHVAITFQAGQAGGAIFYVDGVETDRVDASTLPAGNGPFRIANNQFSNQFFIGMIDDVRLYDHILTPAEVKQLALRTKAYDPIPADNAAGVPQPLFQWKAGGTALMHNVYIGTTPDLTQANLVGPSLTATMFYYAPGLTPGATYYWRVDELDFDNVTIHQGEVWSFTAMPAAAWAPKPADGATFVAPDATLEWSTGVNAGGHDVYFGTDRAAVEAGAPEVKKADAQAQTSYTPAAMEQGQTYYWRVDEFVTGGKVAGPVWSFTLRPVTAVSDPNLVGWWKLDDVNAGMAVDSSGRDNHGTILGPTWVPGYLGEALAFDGVDDSVDCGSDAILNSMGSVTVTAWVKLGALGVDRKILSNQNNSSGGYKLGIYTNNKVEFEIRTSANAATNNRAVANGTVFEPDVWYHVAGVYSKGQFLRTYVNGIMDRETATPNVMGVSTGPLRLGRESYSTAYWWLGLIDEVHIYNKALSDAEIQKAMEGDPLVAQNPQPANGVNVDIESATELSWSAGATAAKHDVYFGADRNAVKAADASSALYQSRQAGTTFSLDGLVALGGGSYFWRIDEIAGDGTTVQKGNVWTFTVPDYLIVDEFESYTDADGDRIYQAWIDGLTTGDNGSTIGNALAPFAERTIVHGGKQSMPMDYNNVGKPYLYSEAEVEFAPARNWTTNGVTDLSLWFRGQPEKFVETASGRYTISSTSGDIAGTADNFRFVWKQLTGDGSIVARVNSVTNTAPWAKAGVMIRETLDAGSTRAHMIVTPSGRRAFENRIATGGPSFSAYSATGAVFAPYWVRIERKGTEFTAYHSPDGLNWIKQPDDENTSATTRSPNPQIIPMVSTVYIGLFVTSNNLLAPCFGEFSDVTMTGSITGDWQVADIGPNKGNARDSLYVVVEDSAGKIATVVNADPAAVTTLTWTEWKIPLSSLPGINLAKVEKLYLGVGDRAAKTPAGSGRIYVDDIRLVGP